MSAPLQLIILRKPNNDIEVTVNGEVQTKTELYGMLKMAEKVIDTMGQAAPAAVITPPLTRLPNLRGPKS